MAISVPLRVTAEIMLEDGDAAGQRRFRLTHELLAGDPPRLMFGEPLPLEGDGNGSLRFALPSDEPQGAGVAIACATRLRCDPERAESGSEAALLGLTAADREAIERYIDQRMET